MNIKKISTAVMAAAVLAVSAPVTGLAEPLGVVARAAETGSVVPQNLRLNGNSLVWDDVAGSRGYILRTFYEGKERTKSFGKNSFNLNRFLREEALPYGEYEFTVCICSENFERGQWSVPFTFNYVPGISAPTNIKQGEDKNGNPIISWTPVTGAFCYNVKISALENGHYRVVANNSYEPGTSSSFKIEDYLGEGFSTGNYDEFAFSFQTIDRDYNFSEWSEPVYVHYEITKPKEIYPGLRNLRFDESGNNVLWDPVEGAVNYSVKISTSIHDPFARGDTDYAVTIDCGLETQLTDWKKYTIPIEDPYNNSYSIYVRAVDETLTITSNIITANYSQERDEAIKMPENIQVNNGIFSVKDTEPWAIFSMNGRIISYCGSSKNAKNDVDPKELPEGTYDVELYIPGENQKYNSKTYKVTLDTPHDNTIWVPELYHWGSGYIKWDCDPLMNKMMDGKSYFWIRARQGENIVDLERSGSYDYRSLPDGEYDIEVCACQNGKLGPWSEPIKVIKYKGTIFDDDSSETTEVEKSPEGADIPDDYRIITIESRKDFNMSHKNGNNVELDLSKLTVYAKEIYDDEGLKRASEALGTDIKGDLKYNIFDLTLLYDGEDFSNGYNGLVQVIIPIPKGNRDKLFSCYRLVEKNGKMVKELIPGEQTEDSYIIYLEHFSEYALVASDTKQEHVHTWDSGVVTKKPTTSNEGIKTYTCTVCSETRTEAIAKLPSSSGGSGSKPSGGGIRPSGGSSSSTFSGMTNEETAAVIGSTESGGKAKIDGNIYIYPEVIKEAVKKNVDLEVKVDHNFTWNIETDKLADIDIALRLSVTKVNVDPDKISKIEKSAGSINNADISFSTYAKNLGSGAVLSVRTSEISTTLTKMFANLYKTDVDGSLEFVAAAPIDENGYAALPIFDAATYIVITSTETKKPGDINNDCKVNMSDITMMLRKYVNSQSLSRATDFKMDYNNDGQCNMSDITALLRAYVDDKV